MKREKVLIVDDEITVLMLLEEAFEGAGYQVVSAESGEKALDILKDEGFKVMFLDLMLPGMNGLELCQKIRKTHTNTRVFAMTGHPDKFEFAACRDEGFDGYFTKPIDVEVFLDTAREAFADLENNQDQNPNG